MADDTREKPSETRSAQPQKIPPPDSKPQISTYIHAPQNANLLPGGTENTAGGKAPAVPGLVDVAKSIKYEEFKDIHKKPCVRDSLLTGIASGFGIGGVRAIVGGENTLLAHTRIESGLIDCLSKEVLQRQLTGP
jgi:cytochrome c oxidase assembly protein subunit 20